MTTILKPRGFAMLYLLVSVVALSIFSSCNKSDVGLNNGNSPLSYSADVLEKWMEMQVRLLRNTPGILNHASSRHYAYSGVAALEAIAPGLPASKQLNARWNDLTGLPIATSSTRYYWPANVNAAMADINRAMFPNAIPADKTAIDSLENALTQSFLADQSQDILNHSAQFGKAVASAVFAWAEADGYKNSNAPYTAPFGPGLWVPTPPAMLPPLTPYWGNNRTIVRGSTNNTQLPPPPPYSTDPNSSFFKMVKEVLDVSFTLTDEQKAMATFWRDVPGVGSPGHWLSILRQVLAKTNTSLDKAAFAYALSGAAAHDALISTWKSKYTYNLVRPVTAIPNIIGGTTWFSFIPTPPHPEYPSAHASLSGAAADALQEVFGDIGTFTDHTYDYMGFTPRSFSSFRTIAEEAGNSRLYAGIHYKISIDAGLAQGRAVTANVLMHPTNK